MIYPPSPDANPTPTFPLLSVSMEGGIHYPHRHSFQTFPQGLPVSYKGWTNDCLLDRSACSHQSQVGEKTHPTGSHLDAPMQSFPLRGHCGQGAGILHPEKSSPPTLLGFESFPTTPDDDITLADANPTNHSSQQKSASKMVPLDQSHRSMHVHATPNVSMTPAIPSSIAVQRASQNNSHKRNKPRKKHAEESSWSSRQPPGMDEALERPYVCHTCGERYAQPGGVTRHYRTKHNPNFCAYCGAGWSRPYQYRNHLEMHHRDVDPDLVLGKPAGSRRRAKVTGRGLTQNVSPHVVQHDRQSQTATQPPPPMPSLPAALKVPLAVSYAEELSQAVNDVADHSPRFPQALQGVFTTANCSSRPVTAHVPFPCPPFGGYYGDQVSADPVFEPSGFFHPLICSPTSMFTPDMFTRRFRPNDEINPHMH